MDQGSPSLNAAVIFFIDSEYLVHDIRTRPPSSVDIQRIVAQTGDPLRLPQRFLARAQRRLRALSLGDVFGEDDDAADSAIAGPPGKNLAPDPLHGSIRPYELSLFPAHFLARQTAPVFLAPRL